MIKSVRETRAEKLYRQALTFSLEKLIVKSPIKRSVPESSPFQLCCDLWNEAKEAEMVLRSKLSATIFLLGILGFTALPSVAQQPAAGNKVVQITGLVGVKTNTNGNLTLENGNLQFAGSGSKVSVPIHSVEDVITENDSQRVFRGTLGTLTMFAPYGGGRFLSLFRSKMDTLTIQYRDTDGGLHGAIFVMPLGKADPFKKDLVSQGARTSIPVQDDSGSPNVKPDAAKEKKP
jgi:hypothetical protein